MLSSSSGVVFDGLFTYRNLFWQGETKLLFILVCTACDICRYLALSAIISSPLGKSIYFSFGVQLFFLSPADYMRLY